jgi:hypothetical protein
MKEVKGSSAEKGRRCSKERSGGAAGRLERHDRRGSARYQRHMSPREVVTARVGMQLLSPPPYLLLKAAILRQCRMHRHNRDADETSARKVQLRFQLILTMHY